MARVDADIAPDVSARTETGDDYQHIQASPAAFGGSIAQGAEGLGEGLSVAAKFWGEVQTDGSVNDANGEATKIVEGFKNLRGQDALNAQEETEKSLQEAYTTRREQLSSMRQKVAFDNSTRSFYQRFLQPQVYNHANQQAYEHATEVNNNGYKLAVDQLASLDIADPHYEAKAEDATKMGYAAAVRNAHLKFGDSATPEDVAGYVRPYVQGLYKTQAQVMAVKDPAGAVDFIDKHRDVIGVDYPALSSQFRARATEQNALGIANDAFSITAHNLQNAAPDQKSTSAVREAILQQESGNQNGVKVSANGAVGPGQITPATFAQYARDGERIENPADNRAVSSRIVDDLSKKYDNDPERIAVGYFSGPGNVAPVGSPTPWIKDTTDANGKSVSSYVSDITHRLGSQGPALAARAGVYDTVLARTEGNPMLREAALKEVGQRYRDAEIADLADQKARKAQSDAALRGYGDEIRAGTPSMGWRRDPRLLEEQVEHLDKLAVDTAKESINGKPGDYGRGYADVQNRILNPSAEQPIRDRAQLLKEYGSGNINPAGLEEAGKWLDWAQKPDNIGNRVLAENFYKSAQRAVTLAMEGSNIKLPGSDDKWNRALPLLNKALEQGRAAGKTDAEMMDPASKDSVWPMLKPFLPSQSEALAFNLEHDVTTEGNPADLTTAEGIKAAVRSGQIKREEGVRIATERGFIRASDTAPQVPQGD